MHHSQEDISGWIAHRADWAPDSVAIRFEGAEISFAEMEDRIGRLAGALSDTFRVREGDRVAHLGVNAPELLELLFACARIGAIFVPLNWRLTIEEHVWQLRDCTPDLLFAEPEYFDHAAALAEAIPALKIATYAGADDRWPFYEHLLDAAEYKSPSRRRDLSIPAKIVYTSGTTGRPKGAVLSQQSLFFTALNGQSVYEFTGADHILTVIPMFHVGGMNIQTLPGLRAGAMNTIHRRFDPQATLTAMVEDRPTLASLVPAIVQALFALPGFAEADLSSLRCVTTGSQAVPGEVFRPFHDRGLPVNQIYGLTESGPTAIALSIADGFTRSTSTGKPVIHCDAKVVVGEDGAEAGPDEMGEVWLRGPNLLMEYWNNPEATADAFADDGWFRTGDIGYRDSDGYFYINDRTKDLIISGGENIYPAELERVLGGCDALAEYTVVGRPDEKWGETPVCVVVRKPGSEISEADILALFDGHLARYKHPRGVIFADGPLPRTSLGKVQKFEVRTAMEAGRL